MVWQAGAGGRLHVLLLLLLLQGIGCASVQRKKQMLLQEGVVFEGNKVRVFVIGLGCGGCRGCERQELGERLVF